MISEELKKQIEERIRQLSRIDPEKECSKSNCHGTLLYLLGVDGRTSPDIVSGDYMMNFYEANCDRIGPSQRTAYDLVTMWRADFKDISNGQSGICLEHSAVLVNPRSETLFHQRDTGLEFEFNTIKQYIAENFRFFGRAKPNVIIRYHRIRPDFALSA